jgi:hypothetical protein
MGNEDDPRELHPMRMMRMRIIMPELPDRSPVVLALNRFLFLVVA